MSPRFEYDLEKSRRNLEVHGIDFKEAQELWAAAHVTISAKKSGREERHAIIGELYGRLHVAIFTMRETSIRLISCHRADHRYLKIYERAQDEKKETKKHHS